MHAKAQTSNRMAKANRASHGPRVSPHTQAKVRVRKTTENPMENPKERKVRTKVLKAHTRAKHRKLVSQVLKTRNQRQVRKLRILHRHVPLTLPGTIFGMVTNGTMDGVLMSGMMTGVLLDSTKVDTSASSFSLGGLDVSATSSPKRFEWVKMNLDTGAAVNTFPLNFSPEGAGDGRFLRTFSGNGFLMVECGNSKDTTKTDCSDL